MPKIVFEKMHGIGNDFVLIDNRNQKIKIDVQLVKYLGNRHKGIGFDQLILLEQSTNNQVDVAYRFFNPDGSEAEQCGNGQRCICMYLNDLMPHPQKFRVSGLAGIIESEVVSGGLIKVNMGLVSSNKKISVENSTLYHVEFGNPHLVLQQKTINECDLESLKYKYTQNYPNGINFELVEIVSDNEINLRVFERGTGETLACGSGACAAVYALQQAGLLTTKVKVVLPGGVLVVEYDEHSHNLFLTGDATHVFTGEIDV